VRHLGLADLPLALREEVGQGRGILLALNGIGNPRATQFQIAKATHEIGIALHKPGIEPVDRVHRLGRVVVPETRRGQGKRQLVHHRTPQKREGRTERSTGSSGRASGIPGLAWAHWRNGPIRKAYSALLTGRSERAIHTRSREAGFPSISAP
jgi:hypothetical protein